MISMIQSRRKGLVRLIVFSIGYGFILKCIYCNQVDPSTSTYLYAIFQLYFGGITIKNSMEIIHVIIYIIPFVYLLTEEDRQWRDMLGTNSCIFLIRLGGWRRFYYKKVIESALYLVIYCIIQIVIFQLLTENIIHLSSIDVHMLEIIVLFFFRYFVCILLFQLIRVNKNELVCIISVLTLYVISVLCTGCIYCSNKSLLGLTKLNVLCRGIYNYQEPCNYSMNTLNIMPDNNYTLYMSVGININIQIICCVILFVLGIITIKKHDMLE